MYTIAVFGRDGRLTEEKACGVRNELTGCTVFKRDRTGRVAEAQGWTAAGELSLRGSEEFYDGEGTRTGAAWF